MIIIILLLIIIICFTLLLLKINIEKDVSSNKVDPKYSTFYQNNIIDNDMLNEIISQDLNANLAAQKHYCISQGLSFDCSDGIVCSCFIKNEDQCDSYRNSLTNPKFYTQEEIKDNETKSILWYIDEQQNGGGWCVSTSKEITSDICDKIMDSDKKSNYKLQYQPPILKCYDKYCDIKLKPTCLIPEGYCESRGMDFENGNCVVSTAQEILELFLGEDIVRCARVGDLDCFFKAVNIPLAIADIICKHAGGMENGCGIPRLLPSVEEIVNAFNTIGEAYEEFGNMIAYGFQIGIDATINFFRDIGADIEEGLEYTFNSVKDFFEDLGKDLDNFFDNIGDEFKNFGNNVYETLEDAGNQIYDTTISPIVDAGESVINWASNAC